MSYRPSPAGLKRDIHMALYVLSVARANLDRLGIASAATTEEASAGSCYDDEPQAK